MHLLLFNFDAQSNDALVMSQCVQLSFGEGRGSDRSTGSSSRGPYNRGYIAASRQHNFYCVRQPRQPRYRLQIVVPGNQVAAKHNSRDKKLFKIILTNSVKHM